MTLAADMVSLGSLSGWLTVIALLGAAWVFYRGGGGTALKSLELANRILEKRVRDLEEQVKADAKTIAVLTARTDITAAIKPLIEWTSVHEEHDREQFGLILAALDRIADRLGPYKNDTLGEPS